MLAKIWHATQVEMHGIHSTERVLELTKYANETSWLRVITILLVTPLPCLVVSVLVDVLPLADPSQGVHANRMYFARLFYTFVVITFLLTHQFRICVPVLPYPLHRAVGYTIIISAVSVVISYGLTGVIGFPLPFSTVIVLPAWLLFVASSLALEWANRISNTPGALTMLVNAIKLWICEILLVFIYLLYYYVFTTLSKKGKVAFALLLPIIKLVMKNIVARSVVHLSDKMPEVVVFNVEVFNALFTSYCMQNTPSIWITLEIMVFDLLMMVFSLRHTGSAHRILKDLERRIEQSDNWNSVASSTRCSSTRLTTLDRASMLLYYAANACPTRIPSVDGAINELSSPAFHQAPSNIFKKAMHLSVAPINTKVLQSIAPTSRSSKQILRMGGVYPTTNNEQSNFTVHYTYKVQQLVYAAEFLLLLNYVEVIIPIVYCTYLL
ncbi:unnamed protein product [Phytophthora lilii]|uniref:Unnamed protein product n=1 Tax=Phytophthora lilii TaxID=2077276 RepID=A0A9W6TBX9_9STRA|nr:unnamed protein product [Phytophthora lilii]